MIDKRSVAQVLEQIAAFMQLKGENAFRVRAFTNAARVVNGFPEELDVALENGTLAQARGIGPVTHQIVSDLMKTGRSSLLDELRAQIPPGLVEMLEIPGLGVARIRQIHDVLGIDSISELEIAARDGRLSKLPRFGPKTADNLLKSIGFLRQTSGFRLHYQALDEANGRRLALERIPGVQQAIVAGEVRRRSEIVRDIVLVLVSDVAEEAIVRHLAELPGIQEITALNQQRVTLRFAGGSTAQVVMTTQPNLGYALVQATGSVEHLGQLQKHAASRGFEFKGGGLGKSGTLVPTPDEATFYRSLGLDEIPPELREGLDEIEAAEQHRIPRLVEMGDLHGLLHCHTTYSDGSCTVRELAVAARDAGYSYVGITDHSQAATYAGGLTVEDLARQGTEIDEVNASLEGIRVLKGIEADILADGQVDYPRSVLADLDFVIASVHSRFNMNAQEMTARILTALDNPYVSILGHPTGRLLLSRSPFPVDLGAVFARAAERGVAMEINGDPHRLDLDWRLVREARSRGVAISIGADAHSLAALRYMENGIGIARKAWLTRDDVLNALPVDRFTARLQRVVS